MLGHIVQFRGDTHLKEIIEGSKNEEKKSVFEIECICTAIDACESIGRAPDNNPIWDGAIDDCKRHIITIADWRRNYRLSLQLLKVEGLRII